MKTKNKYDRMLGLLVPLAERIENVILFAMEEEVISKHLMQVALSTSKLLHEVADGSVYGDVCSITVKSAYPPQSLNISHPQ